MPTTAAVSAAMGTVSESPPNAGETVPDALGEHDVRGPPDGCETGEPEAGGVGGAVPGLGQQDDPDQCDGGPGERSPAVAAHGGDGQGAEELDGDGGAERDALDGGQERDGHQ